MTIEALGPDIAVNIWGAYVDQPNTGTFEVQLNNGLWKTVNWTDIGQVVNDEFDISTAKKFNFVAAADSSKTTMSTGDKLRFRSIDKWSGTEGNFFDILVTSELTDSYAKVYGKLSESLTNGFDKTCSFSRLFGGSTALVDASGFDLSETMFRDNCYLQMFVDCTSLTAAPKLSSMTVMPACYASMFENCIALTNAPSLPATTLSSSCYSSMFMGCTSLTSAPMLPATSLARYCYSEMFSGCTALQNVPVFTVNEAGDSCCSKMFSDCISLIDTPVRTSSSTTLSASCFDRMFYNCSSLTNANDLLAMTLADSCYSRMFYKCSSLTCMPKLLASDLCSQCYYYMFNNCTSITGQVDLSATALVSHCYTYMFTGCTGITEIHYPKSIEVDSTFTRMSGSPTFGAVNAHAIYDINL